MDENSSTMSQDAIDALLESQAAGDADEEAVAAVDRTAGTGDEDQTDAGTGPSDEPTAGPSEALAGTDADEEGAAVSAVADQDIPAAPEDKPAAKPRPVPVNTPPPPGATPPPGVVSSDESEDEGLSEEQLLAMIGEATDNAVIPVQNDVSILSGRIDALETALAKIKELEAQVAELKKSQNRGDSVTLEMLKPLVDRVVALEKGAKGDPLFNLYEKFNCSSCYSNGTAQARARCSKCGKEGWFGRREAA